MVFTFHYELIITINQCRIIVLFIPFTFHYELIITTSTSKRIENCISIYISLWTNYNISKSISKLALHLFTFHYELIITIFITNSPILGNRFTFHYELIITFTRFGSSCEFTMIYISLWTNYNRVWYYIDKPKENLHFTMN